MRQRIDHDRVRALASDGKTDAEIAAIVGCNQYYARQIVNGRMGGSQEQSRLNSYSIYGRIARMPALDNEAVMQSRTIYPSTVISPTGEAVLKSGFNSAKIGRRVTKGRWKGFEIYTLTLEERATCPKSCRHWRSCYGNGMHLARRFAHGPTLEGKIAEEVAELSRRHPRGFAIRLHSLGDFYSVQYVRLWADLLNRYPRLHAFGFSARSDYQNDPVAKALIDLVGKRWARFAIRLSNAPISECSTISIEHPYQKPDDTIICPQQLGKTLACATCALCWQTTKRIAFIQH